MDGAGAEDSPTLFRDTNLTTGIHPKLVGNPGNEVCLQRWTLLQFFMPAVDQFWFCYLPQDRWPACEEGIGTFVMQGEGFVVLMLVGLAPLSYLMRKQTPLAWALTWGSRLLLNLELALVSVAVLVHWGYDGEAVKLAVFAFVGTVVVFNVLMLPHRCCISCGDQAVDLCKALAMWYLFAVTFSPCAVAEIMSYWPALTLIVLHRPMLIGIAAFGVEITRTFLCSSRSPDAEHAKRRSDGGPAYAQMYRSDAGSDAGEEMRGLCFRER
jgi:hypothetical protein